MLQAAPRRQSNQLWCVQRYASAWVSIPHGQACQLSNSHRCQLFQEICMTHSEAVWCSINFVMRISWWVHQVHDISAGKRCFKKCIALNRALKLCVWANAVHCCNKELNFGPVRWEMKVTWFGPHPRILTSTNCAMVSFDYLLPEVYNYASRHIQERVVDDLRHFDAVKFSFFRLSHSE